MDGSGKGEELEKSIPDLTWLSLALALQLYGLALGINQSPKKLFHPSTPKLSNYPSKYCSNLLLYEGKIVNQGKNK